MEARAYIKNVKVTPKKLRFLVPQIKKLSPRQALDRLLYFEKKPARILYKAIQSAVNNAKNVLKVEDSKLIFKTLAIEEGQKMKRYKAGGRGAVKPFKRRFAHIKVVLTVGKSNVVKLPEAKPVTKEKPLKIAKAEKTQLKAVKKAAVKK